MGVKPDMAGEGDPAEHCPRIEYGAGSSTGSGRTILVISMRTGWVPAFAGTTVRLCGPVYQGGERLGGPVNSRSLLRAGLSGDVAFIEGLEGGVAVARDPVGGDVEGFVSVLVEDEGAQLVEGVDCAGDLVAGELVAGYVARQVAGVHDVVDGDWGEVFSFGMGRFGGALCFGGPFD